MKAWWAAGCLLLIGAGAAGAVFAAGGSVTAGSGSVSSVSSGSVSSVSGSGSGWSGVRLPSVAFVVTCRADHEAPDDPLVHPSHPGSSHRHVFYGNTDTGAFSTPASLRSRGSTTCSDPADRAAYWTPAPAGDHLRAYYDAGEADPSVVAGFPFGMSGIAGSPTVMQPGVDVVGFRCGAVADGPSAAGWVASPPPSCTSKGTVVRYTFGQCADDLKLRLRMCHAREAAKYVRLRLVVQWMGSSSIGPHADFWNAWNDDRLEYLVATCVRGERKTNLAIKVCGLPGSGPATGAN